MRPHLLPGGHRGIEPASKDVILSQMREQAQIAIDSAAAIILVTDIRSGVTATDQGRGQPSAEKRRAGGAVRQQVATQWGSLRRVLRVLQPGAGRPGDGIVRSRPRHGGPAGPGGGAAAAPEEEEEEGDAIKVAVIGKPNVGKSSLVNKVAGENRCIVSDIAGTTRDAVDTTIQNEYGTFTFIDTAGLRRKSRVEDAIEHYSNLRAEMAVERADVCLILIDAQVGFSGAGLESGGHRPRGREGLRHLREQVGRRGEGHQHHGRDAQKAGGGLLLHVLRAHPVHLRQDPGSGWTRCSSSSARRRPTTPCG